MKLLVALVVALAVLPIAGCGGSKQDNPAAVEAEQTASVVDELSTKAQAAAMVCEDYLNGEMDYAVALSIMEDYEEEIDDLCDAAADEGVYTSIDLYVGEMRATLSSWDQLETIGDDPRSMLTDSITSLNSEIQELDSD